MVENATSLHMCIDELLLSAMTLCKYCLVEDQTILKARCQVVCIFHCYVILLTSTIIKSIQKKHTRQIFYSIPGATGNQSFIQ